MCLPQQLSHFTSARTSALQLDIERGSPPTPCTDFRLAHDMVPELVMIWEMIMVRGVSCLCPDFATYTHLGAQYKAKRLAWSYAQQCMVQCQGPDVRCMPRIKVFQHPQGWALDVV
jgi:hypothetical protein